MMVIGLSGTQYQLDAKLLSDGGEGKIYRVFGGSLKKVAKIYKTGVPTSELEEKLTLMVNRPPSSKVLSQVAWPLDVIYDTNKQFCGFIMPELNINAELGEIYKYPSQINITSQQKIIVAENICAVISEVHKAGYVFGDFNPRNIGVDKNSGTVAFLDTDTYHVVAQTKNMVYRCNVCAPGYSAPELLEKCAAHIAANPNDKSHAYAKTPLPTFTMETDNFALAVHIFKLLMNGYTPYGGIKDTDSPSQSSPGTGDAAVRRDNYCFKPGYKHQSVAIPSLDTFPQEISDLFTRAFIVGKADPRQRPTAFEWFDALSRFEKALVTCSKNSFHQYYKMNSTCPLCNADHRYSISISPSISQKQYSRTVQPIVQTNIQTPQHLPHSPNHAYKIGATSGSSSNTSVGKIWKPLVGLAAAIVLIIIVANRFNKKETPNIAVYNDSAAVNTTAPVLNNSASSNTEYNNNILERSVITSTPILGSMVQKGQIDSYSYYAPISGTYGFNISSDFDLRISIFTTNEKEIKSGYNHVKTEFKAGETYFVNVEQYRDLCPYELNIGVPNEIENITNLTFKEGNLTYIGQVDTYIYEASISGRYQFKTEADLQTYTRVETADTGKLIATGWGGSRDPANADLDAGRSYRITIEQEANDLCPYTLFIGAAKPTEELSGLMTGEITYSSQNDRYSFTPNSDGVYIISVTSDKQPNITVRTETGAEVGFQGYGTCTVELTANKKYIIHLSPYYISDLAPYSIRIDKK